MEKDSGKEIINDVKTTNEPSKTDDEPKESDNTHNETANEKQSELLNRLSQYTWINSLYQGYNSIKHSNTYIKAGLELGETGGQKLIATLEPVIQKLDDKLHLDEKGVQILDKIETTAAKVSGAYETGKEKGKEYVHTQTDKAIETSKVTATKVTETLETGKEKAKEFVIETGKGIVANMNRPVNQLLDVTESLVDKLLPPDVSRTEEHDSSTAANTTEQSEATATRLEANPLPRISEVSKKVQEASLAKLRTINFRNPADIAAMAYVVDLIQFAAEYIDIDRRTTQLKETSDAVQHMLADKKETINNLMQPTRQIIEQQTADIKSAGVKAVVTIVSTIAHASEVIRRQILRNKEVIQENLDVNQLQQNLINITLKTKESVLKLKEPELASYLEQVRGIYSMAISSVVELTHQVYVGGIPAGLAHLNHSLAHWYSSLSARLEEKTDTATETDTTKADTTTTQATKTEAN